MKAHELARALLAGPDLEVWARDPTDGNSGEFGPFDFRVGLVTGGRQKPTWAGMVLGAAQPVIELREGEPSPEELAELERLRGIAREARRAEAHRRAAEQDAEQEVDF